ncbi:MAG: hypothetical protein KGI06_05470 [Candidatus Micrarchaeota archaeon]|nr:hypothetical protein [Candidatus Micrarchaeota archaeon]
MRFLKDNRMPVFRLDDAVKILKNSREYARLFLHRAIKSNIIGRAERGLYYLREGSNEYEIASHVLYPSYISMISALHYYGLTTQIPNTVYVISPKRHKIIKNVAGFDIVFRKISSHMMFGYHKESDGNIFIADKEKAIVDIFYFRDVNDLDYSVLEKPARIDVDKLALYAEMSRNRSVIKNVSELLSSYGYAKQARRLQSGLATAQMVLSK